MSSVDFRFPNGQLVAVPLNLAMFRNAGQRDNNARCIMRMEANLEFRQQNKSRNLVILIILLAKQCV